MNVDEVRKYGLALPEATESLSGATSSVSRFERKSLSPLDRLDALRKDELQDLSGNRMRWWRRRRRKVDRQVMEARESCEEKSATSHEGEKKH